MNDSIEENRMKGNAYKWRFILSPQLDRKLVIITRILAGVSASISSSSSSSLIGWIQPDDRQKIII